MRREGGLEDHVLGIEAGEEREAGKRQRTDPHHRIGERDLLPYAAHVAKVLFVGQRVDDRPRPKEQQRLEEGMRRQVKHRRRIGRHTGSEEHVAELRAGRIRDYPLYVELREADRRREDRGHRPDNGNDVKRQRRIFQHRRQAADHEDARRHHRRGMDQRRHRCRPLHCVGKPCMKAKLGRFAHRPDEQQDAGNFQRRHRRAKEVDSGAGGACRIGENGVELNRAENLVDSQDAKGKAEITDTVDDKGLHRGGVGAVLLIPETDQKIGGYANPFPAEEQLHEVVGRHQHQHGKGEQAEIGHEARARPIMRHVADGIKMHHRRDAGDDNQHHRCQRVEAKPPHRLEVTRDDPAGQVDGDRLAANGNLRESDDREKQRQQQETHCHQFGRTITMVETEPASDQRAKKRQEDNRSIHS